MTSRLGVAVAGLGLVAGGSAAFIILQSQNVSKKNKYIAILKVQNMTTIFVNENITFNVSVTMNGDTASGLPVTLFDKASSTALATGSTAGNGTVSFTLGFTTSGTYVVYADVGSPASIDSNSVTITVINNYTIHLITNPANDATLIAGNPIVATATLTENGASVGAGIPVTLTFVEHEHTDGYRGMRIGMSESTATPIYKTTINTDSGGQVTARPNVYFDNPEVYGDVGFVSVVATSSNGATSGQNTINITTDTYSAELTDSVA